jgi:hypothetical protein
MVPLIYGAIVDCLMIEEGYAFGLSEGWARSTRFNVQKLARVDSDFWYNIYRKYAKRSRWFCVIDWIEENNNEDSHFHPLTEFALRGVALGKCYNGRPGMIGGHNVLSSVGECIIPVFVWGVVIS